MIFILNFKTNIITIISILNFNIFYNYIIHFNIFYLLNNTYYFVCMY